VRYAADLGLDVDRFREDLRRPDGHGRHAATEEAGPGEVHPLGPD
jgi:hypothetical protein